MDMMIFYCKRGLGLNFRYSRFATLSFFIAKMQPTLF